MTPRPPLLPRLLLRLIPRPHRDIVAGDLEEEYLDTILPDRGLRAANRWFWGQVLGSVGAFIRARLARSGPPPLLPPVVREMRHAGIALRRRPGFTVLAVLTLGTGIGAGVSVYSAAHWLLLRPVSGVEAPERLVMVSFETETGNSTGVSLPNLRDLVAAAPAIAGGSGYIRADLQFSAGAGTEARSVATEIVTAGYFRLLDVHAQVGRFPSRQEAEGPHVSLVAVLGDRLWTSLFQRDVSAVGRTIRVNGLPFTVVGVAPPDFHGSDRLVPADLWLGAAAYPELRRFPASSGLALENRRTNLFGTMVGRLAPGASAEQAQEQLNAAMLHLADEHPEENAIHKEYRPRVIAGLGASVGMRESLTKSLRRLSWMVLLILVTACANVANLLVLRGVRRRGEIAVRRALGASGGHMLLQSVGESLLLALPAAAVGLVLAFGLNRILWTPGFLLTGGLRDVPINGSTLLFAIALSAGTALVFGTIPGIAAARVNVGEQLKGTQRTASGGGSRLQGGLTILQLSLSLVLLTSAFLLGRSVANLTSQDFGFDPGGLHQYIFNPAPQGYTMVEVVQLHRRAFERIAALPEVNDATASVHPPFSGAVTRYRMGPAGEEDPRQLVHVDWVSENFFEVLKIPMVDGRVFEREEVVPGDPETDVVVVSRGVARALFGTAPAVGRTFAIRTFTGILTPTIVGVVEDVQGWDLRKNPEPRIYLPLRLARGGSVEILVRSSGPPQRVDQSVRRAFASIDARVPVDGPVPMSRQIERAVSEERTMFRLVGILAAFGIVLGGVGLYTVVAYATAVRRREFGIRIAIGSSRRRILATVVRQSLLFGAVGAGFGLALTFASSRLLRAMLFGLGPADPRVTGGAVGILLLVTLLASAVPALSATRIDPAEPMRAE